MTLTHSKTWPIYTTMATAVVQVHLIPNSGRTYSTIVTGNSQETILNLNNNNNNPDLKITTPTPSEDSIQHDIVHELIRRKYDIVALTNGIDVPERRSWEYVYKRGRPNSPPICPIHNPYKSRKSSGQTTASTKLETNIQQNFDVLDELKPLDPKKLVTLCRHYYPEGGWGWVIAACSVIVHLLTCGLQLGCASFTIPTMYRFHTSVVETAGEFFFCFIRLSFRYFN